MAAEPSKARLPAAALPRDSRAGAAHRGICLALALLAGCDKLLSLAEIPQPPPGSGDGGVDGAPLLISATHVRRYISNDPAGMPTASTVPFATGELTAAVRLADGTPLQLSDLGGGNLQFTAPAGATYALAFRHTDGSVIEYQSSTPVLATAETVLGRADAVTPTATTGNNFDATFSTMNPSSVFVLSTGVWFEAHATAPTAGQYQTVWTGQLTDPVKNDVTYLVGYEDRGTYGTIVQSQSFPKTLIDGQQNVTTVGAPIPYTNPTHCHHITAEAAQAARYPSNGQGIELDWGMYAIPLPQYTILAALELALARAPTPSTGSDIFYDPVFPHLPTMAALLVSSLRTVGPYALHVSGAHFVAVSDPTTCDAMTLTSTLAIPSEPTLAGVPLTSDNIVVGLPPGITTIAWTDAVAGDPTDLYHVMITAPSPSPPTPDLVVREIYTRDHAVTIDPSIFSLGQDYFININAIEGAAGASSGDFDTLSATDQQLINIPSHVFRVSR
jgi:hypothetical protein